MFTAGKRAMDVTGIEAHSLGSEGSGRQTPNKQVAVDSCGEHCEDRYRGAETEYHRDASRAWRVVWNAWVCRGGH